MVASHHWLISQARKPNVWTCGSSRTEQDYHCSWLGPLSFLVLINDLSAGCSIVKYVDDSTLSELLQPKSHTSEMTQFLQNLLTWMAKNHMQVNSAKTKEMIIGPLAKINLPLLTTSLGTIERVSSFKVLGVYIESSLGWSTHVNSIVKKPLPDSTSSSN